ncbi:MAG TPA: hypothetical protein VKZ55_03845 [Microthrixaceae bacterium]|nr:hypothetical protein [Microthrixaceae bacterium]
MPELTDAEDRKLVVLARSTGARAGATGAAVRDLEGRTYASAAVALPSLAVSAIAGCLAMAISAGSRGLEAVVVVGDDDIDAADLAAVREFAGSGVPVHRVDRRGELLGTTGS